jgi:hypothetical protein
MNLPFVIDVAIGLIFIYLILSLLASELQELLTTLLQWRAKHLRDSIEVFLAGGVDGKQEAVKDLVSKLYDDPLIKNVNQEAKGLIAQFLRRLTRWIPGNRKGAFGTKQSTGPSYIASDTFATSLLERLGLAGLTKTLMEVRLEKFATRIIGEYDRQTLQPYPDTYFTEVQKNSWQKGRLRLLAQDAGVMNLDQDSEFKLLVAEYNDILNDFEAGEATLDTCVERMGESLINFITNYLPSSSPNSGKLSNPGNIQGDWESRQHTGDLFSASPSESIVSDPREGYSTGVTGESISPNTGERYYTEGIASDTGESYFSEGISPSTGEGYYTEGTASDTGESYFSESISPGTGEGYYTEGRDESANQGMWQETTAQESGDSSTQVGGENLTQQSDTQAFARSYDSAYLIKRLKAFKSGIFGEKNERAVLSGGLRPTLLELAQLVNEGSNVYREVAGAYQAVVNEGRQIEATVNAELESRLLREQPEVLAQQLAERYPIAIATQFEEHYRKVFRDIKRQLELNQEKIRQAEASAYQPDQRRRDGVPPNRAARVWQWLTDSDLDGLKKQQQRTFNRGFDKLTTPQLQHLNTVMLHSLESEARCDVITSALNQLDAEEEHLMLNSVLTDLVQGNRLTEEQCAIYDKYQTYKETRALLNKLPKSVKQSFEILARRSQKQLQRTTNNVEHFREEVAVWFDRSMSRASGVYKRNAKGVAILIGLILASSTNTDTFYIANRLSSDSDLREVITEQAVNLRPSPSPSPTESPRITPDDLRAIKVQTDEILKELTLPIGWKPVNLSQQLGCPQTSNTEIDDPADWAIFFSDCLPPGQAPSDNWMQNIAQVGVQNWLAIPKLLLGWLLSAIAISMGAPFWFDLLNKVVNVRNSGSKPSSANAQDQQTTQK